LAHADASRLGGADEGVTLQEAMHTCCNRKTIFLHDGGNVAVTLDDRGRRNNELKLDAPMGMEGVQHRLDTRIAGACRNDHTDFTNHGLWPPRPAWLLADEPLRVACPRPEPLVTSGLAQRRIVKPVSRARAFASTGCRDRSGCQPPS